MKIRQITTCHTCRARKLACDGKTPACSQCAKSGRACAGYQHDLIFRPPTVSTHHQAPIRNNKRRRITPPEGSKKKQPPHRSPSLEQQSTKVQVAKQLLDLRPGSIPPSLSWPLLDIISLVVQNFSPIEFLEQPFLVPAASGTSAQRVCGAWVEALPELARDGQAERLLLPAIKTLAVSIMSRGQHGRAPVSDALEAHTLALSSLRCGLWDMAHSGSNILAAATMCLYLSEMLLPTSSSSALIHAKGIGDLLQLQGPEFYSSGIGHQLFVGFRPVMFIEFFMSRQNAFLAEERWLVAPFSISGASPIQTLFSELITLPLTIGVVEGLENMPAERVELAARAAFVELERLLRKLLSLGERLDVDGYGRYCFPEKLFQNRTAIQFPSITAANFFTHNWAFHIVCVRQIASLISHFPSLREQLGPGLEGHISKSAVIHLASLILQSIEFLTLDKFKLFGAASTMLPLHVVSEVLKDEGKEEEELWYWYREVLRISSTTGYNFMAGQVLD